MIEIKIHGQALDLPSGFSMEIEDSNPIFNDRGSQSIPATVPTTRRNIRLLEAPHRIDSGVNPNIPERSAEVAEGGYMRLGTMNITEAGRKNGVTFNIGFDNSTAYVKWQQKKLTELETIPVFVAPDIYGHPVDNLLEELYRIYREADPQIDDLAVFPLAINNQSTGTDSDKKIYWEVLNLIGDHGLEQPTTVKRLLDNEVTDVSVPYGYMVSPFIRVWKVLELIFRDLGMTVKDNPFRKDPELARLVVLNNAADSVCTGKLRYSDIMPDSTVEEFLNALWVRFGLVYNIDNNTGIATLTLLKDIIDQRDSREISHLITNSELIKYNEAQYVKLTAGTSIEGATPANERFEDFIKGLDVSKVYLGANVSQWLNKGTGKDPHWDGDYMDSWDEDYNPWEDQDWDDREPDWGDPDDDRWDDRDDNVFFDTRSGNSTQGGISVNSDSDTFLAREFVTGMWHRLDSTNGKVRASSSSFFNWDPQPEGLSPLELSSGDECVPVGKVNTYNLGTGHNFHDYCPHYLFGARHYHSYIKGDDAAENSGDKTPLAFMFAYTYGNKTIGRLTPEGEDGLAVILDDGTKPKLTLLFQFKDGLFANFWSGYDEILRHGNRSVEVNTRINKLDLLHIDLLKPYTFRGIRVLIDTMTYSLPSGREISVDMKLRTIQTQGEYDIKKEQNIPDFGSATRHLEWLLYSETFGDSLNTALLRAEAAKKFIEETGYQGHGSQGDEYYVDWRGVMLKNKVRLSPTWQTDNTKPEPTSQGQKLLRNYKAIITYTILEIHDTSKNDEESSWALGDTPIGEISLTVDYKVELYSKFVND